MDAANGSEEDWLFGSLGVAVEEILGVAVEEVLDVAVGEIVVVAGVVPEFDEDRVNCGELVIFSDSKGTEGALLKLTAADIVEVAEAVGDGRTISHGCHDKGRMVITKRPSEEGIGIYVCEIFPLSKSAEIKHSRADGFEEPPPPLS